MNKILAILLISLALYSSGGYGFRLSGMDFDDDSFEDAEEINGLEKEQDQDVKLAENCLIKILGPSVTCIMRSLAKWKVNPHMLKGNINHKPTCCSLWEVTDCLKGKAQLFCIEEEKTAFETHINTQTHLRNERNCSLFQYKTNACSGEHQEPNDSPVFTRVSLRENNHILSTNQLEDKIIPKKRHAGFGLVHPVHQMIRTGALDELTLAQRLLDRVDRITINHMVIDLHPVKGSESATKQESVASQQEVEIQ